MYRTVILSLLILFSLDAFAANKFRRIFVTAVDYQGNLGGLASADSVCTINAGNAGLPGTWIALLSSSTSSLKSRLGTITKAVNMNGDVVFNRDWNKLGVKEAPFASLDGTNFILSRITYDQSGTNLGSITAWTGTESTGLQHASTCGDWTVSSNASTGNTGFANSSTSTWISNGTTTCDAYHHIYCIEKFD